ncbi:CsbD family protein [Limnofasciculus baicalensis]|uniref:CsbD family protein n=1 Tax=Limnofasciculus baicalensis TaxID=3064906 RepID=UPI002112B91D|nr:CsbD family protein [Limnofasciculus baicalensis]
MISIQQIRSLFLTMSLAVILSTTIAFGFGSADSWAATSPTQLISQTQNQILAMNQAEATIKNIEGKAQETMGNITGNRKDQIMGKAKQVESKASTAAEKMKDKVQDILD